MKPLTAFFILLFFVFICCLISAYFEERERKRRISDIEVQLMEELTGRRVLPRPK